MKEITKEDLIVNETVLIHKDSKTKATLIDCGVYGNIFHLYSNENKFISTLSLAEINKYFTLEEKPSKVVPFETKVYDFVPVKVRDDDNKEWCFNYKLIAVRREKDSLPYIVINEYGVVNIFEQAEFI
jgi:hypothetical protein